MALPAKDMVPEEKTKRSSAWLLAGRNHAQNPPFTEKGAEAKVLVNGAPEPAEPTAMIKKKKQPGGWRAIVFILGNETLERLASAGLLANFMVYLMTKFHLEQVDASNVLNIWGGITNLAPLAGAYIADAYLGRFRTIAIGSFFSLLGMVTMTLTAWLPHLHPSSCRPGWSACSPASKLQLGVLFAALGCLSIGSGGIRPCSIPFGVDQFDQTTEEGLKGVASFFNWYYMTFTVVLLITQTVVVYIQDAISWVIGFAVPTALMGLSIVLFFIGTRVYVHVKPEGSIFSSIIRVFVAAYKKRKVAEGSGAVFYDPPLNPFVLSKIPHTKQFRFLNKAAVITGQHGLNSDGSPTNPWRLCSVQEVEEVKCLIRIVPVWSAGVICLTAMAQQGTFTVSQAMKMDRRLGHSFQVPAGSVSVISFVTIGAWLPFYDQVLVPSLRRVTKREGGITLLQRIGIGIVFSILAMVVAGVVERERRAAAHAGTTISVFWLAPQLVLMGLCEAFNIIGQIEFFNSQFPEHMRSIANSLFSLSFAGSNYLSSLVVSAVHHSTGHPDWLTKDLDQGKLDYFYYLIAVMGVLDLIYFVYVAKKYRYKGSAATGDGAGDGKLASVDVEMSIKA